MTRITDIQESAASSTGGIQAALLQCAILADELNYEPLATWTNYEIAGYPSRELLPEYRIVRSRLRGTLHEPRLITSKKYVPEHLIDEQIREDAQTLFFFDGVSRLMSVKDDGSLSQSIASLASVTAVINAKLERDYGGYGLVGFDDLELPFPPGVIAGVLGAIQHRIVKFMIELNRIFPSQKKLEEQGPNMHQQVERSFKNSFSFHNVDNLYLSAGSMSVDQSHNELSSILVGDFSSLDAFLSRQKVPAEAREELRPILEKLDLGDESEDTGNALTGWIEKQSGELADGVGDVLKEGTKRASTEMLVGAIKSFIPKAAGWISALDYPTDGIPFS